jgi:hypothetical protein
MRALSTESLGSQQPPLIVLTGGLRCSSTFQSVIADNHAHLLGIGRLSVLCPDLPLRLNIQGMAFVPPPEPDLSDSTFDLLLTFISKLGLTIPKLIGAGRQLVWYNLQIRCIAQGRDLFSSIGGVEGILKFLIWRLPNFNNNPGAGRNNLPTKGFGMAWRLVQAPTVLLVLFVAIISWFTCVTVRS